MDDERWNRRQPEDEIIENKKTPKIDAVSNFQPLWLPLDNLANDISEQIVKKTATGHPSLVA